MFTGFPGLSILPNRVTQNNVSKALYSPRLRTILETLTKRYDMVMVDAPPILSVADTRIVAPLTDALILVLRSGVTQREGAMEAYQLIQEDGVALLGTVLTDYDLSSDRRRQYYYDYGRPQAEHEPGTREPRKPPAPAAPESSVLADQARDRCVLGVVLVAAFWPILVGMYGSWFDEHAYMEHGILVIPPPPTWPGPRGTSSKTIPRSHRLGCGAAALGRAASPAGALGAMGLGQPDGVSDFAGGMHRGCVRLADDQGTDLSAVHADSDDRAADFRF